MIYTKNEVLKEEGHIVLCDNDAYLGVSVQMVTCQCHLVRGRVTSMTMATSASRCTVKDVHHIHRIWCIAPLAYYMVKWSQTLDQNLQMIFLNPIIGFEKKKS